MRSTSITRSASAAALLQAAAALRQAADALAAAADADPDPQPTGPAWLSPAQAAAQLGIARSTLYRALEAAEVPSRKVAGRRLIPASYVDAAKAGER